MPASGESAARTASFKTEVDERLFKKFGHIYTENSIIFNEGDTGLADVHVLSGRIGLERVDC